MRRRGFRPTTGSGGWKAHIGTELYGLEVFSLQCLQGSLVRGVSDRFTVVYKLWRQTVAEALSHIDITVHISHEILQRR